jgi:hypothetical protein
MSMLVTTAALVVASAPALGATHTKNCGGDFKIRAHGLSCKAAKKNLQNGAKGYTCKQVGHPKKPPFTIKCRKNKKTSVFYTYETNGG